MACWIAPRCFSIALIVLAAGSVPANSVAQAPPPRPATQPPPQRPAQDLRFRTVYASGGQRTESVSYQKGVRERFEFGDMVVLKQPDVKRTVQISRAANTYLVIPDGGSPLQAGPPPAIPAPAPGVITVTTTIIDTGERKTAFGLQARHVKTTIDRQPGPGACDTSRQRIEMDAWYVDMPAPVQPVQATAPPAPGGCADQVQATHNGDPRLFGFPISYVTTVSGEDGRPNVVTMEITELEATTLDAALFDIPAGLRDAGDIRALSQAVSDANEAQLAQQIAAAPATSPKAPGVTRLTVPELTNRTAHQVDTRALRARLIEGLTAAKLEAIPLPAGAQPELLQHTAAGSGDYLLVAEITELKVSKGGGLGGVLKAASKVTGAGPTKDPTEAAIVVKLVQPDGKTRVSTTVKGKDGGFDLKAGLSMAQFAGTMYMNMMTGRMMMNALSGPMAGNLKGLGMLSNPALLDMQTQGLGQGLGMPGGVRMGLDPTAGAASFLMQQAATLESAGTAPGQPSFDTALQEALEAAAKAVAENLSRRAR